jgi:hypothetical protein
MDWRLPDAASQLEAIFDLALREGPQTIWREDRAVVMIEAEEFRRLTHRRSEFKQALFDGPSLEGLDLERDKSPGREVDFGPSED